MFTVVIKFGFVVTTFRDRDGVIDLLSRHDLSPGLGFTEWAAAGELGPWFVTTGGEGVVAVVVRS